METRPAGRAVFAGIQSGAPAVGGQRVLMWGRLEAVRRLPLPGEVLVTEGQRVEPDTIIAEAPRAPARLHIVELSQALDRQLSPEEVRAALLKQQGDAVRAGEPLARVRVGWMDRETLEAVSPVDGVVEFVSQGRAQVVIRSQAEQAEERVVLQVAAHMGLEPSELRRHAVCRPGQLVDVGDLLARVAGFSLLSNEYRSPVAGVVESVSALTGTITVVQDRRPVVLRAFLSGRVERVLPGYGAVVAAWGHRVLGVLGLGGKSWGRLCLLGDVSQDDGRENRAVGTDVGHDLLSPAQVLPEHAGCVLVVPGQVGDPALQACRELGVRAVIAGSARARALGTFLGRPLAAEIVTGPGALALRDQPGHGRGLLDEPGLTVILTEGFGRLAMDQEVLAILRAHAGRVVSVDGLTQIRAGVVRPAVLLPDEEGTGGGVVSPQAAATRAQVAMQKPRTGSPHPAGAPFPADASLPAATLVPAADVGSRVRIVRHPYFGLRGTVVRPPGGLVRLETEVEARVLEIRLDDGRVVRVAEANVELQEAT